MGISRPLAAAALLLLIAVAGAATEEPVAVAADSVAGAVEAAARAEEAKEAAALRAELDQLRAKISTLGQWQASRFKIKGALDLLSAGVIWLGMIGVGTKRRTHASLLGYFVPFHWNWCRGGELRELGADSTWWWDFWGMLGRASGICFMGV
jgi:hypothetical protein